MMETWVTRAMGPAFHRDRFCDYTGVRLHPFPLSGTLMGFWMENSRLLRKCRLMTREESDWIASNSQEFERQKVLFEAWRDKLQTLEK